MFNENIDITSKSYLNTETHTITKSSVHDEPSYIIQTEPVSNLGTKNMMIKKYAVDDDANSFETPRKMTTVSLQPVPRFC